MSCPQLGLTFIIIWTILIAVVGSVGNLLTIASFLKTAKFKQLTNIFIINLAFADLLFCMISAPLIATQIWIGKQYFYSWICNLFSFFYYVSLAASLFGLTCITITRYLIIAHNNFIQGQYAKYLSIVVIISIWLLPAALVVPNVFNLWGKSEYEGVVCMCIGVDNNGHNPYQPVSLFLFALTCGVNVFCYFHIFWMVRKSKCNLARHKNQNAIAGGNKHNMKTTKIISVMTSVTLICFIPLLIVKSTIAHETNVKYSNYYLLVLMLTWSHSCLNPIIYISLIPKYRQLYLNLLSNMQIQKTSNKNKSEMLSHLDSDNNKYVTSSQQETELSSLTQVI